MTPKKIYDEMQRRMAAMKATTIVDPESMTDVVEEATLHLVEHFKPADRHECAQDYVFIMGQTFLGYDTESGDKRTHPFSFFATGDLHNFAHNLADLMESDPGVARFVFHACELYNGGRARPIKKHF